jgi:hypothetical protein
MVSFSISVSGGTPNYTYSWTGDNPITGDGTNTISNLATGNYQIVVTDDNNCQETANFFMDENSSISILSNVSDYNGFNVKCYGGNDAVGCRVFLVEGLLPYDFSWVDEQSLDTISRQADVYELEAGKLYIYGN